MFMNAPDFSRFIRQWSLTKDGTPFRSTTSWLLPVQYQGIPAMLKVTDNPMEQAGARLMMQWAGEGAARVLAHYDDAVLLERAGGSRSLARMSAQGQDDQATQLICDVAIRLHAHRIGKALSLISLVHWFRPLLRVAGQRGGLVGKGAELACELLASEQGRVALHGDLHHDNVLDFGRAGWRAIDPKGLYGDRGYDYALLFFAPLKNQGLAAKLFERRLEIVNAASGIDRIRLCQWILACAGLSAVLEQRHGVSADAMEVCALAVSTLEGDQ